MKNFDNMLLFELDKAFLEAKDRLGIKEIGTYRQPTAVLYYISEALFINRVMR